MKRIFGLILIVILTCGAGYEGELPDLDAEMGYKIKTKIVKPVYQKPAKDPVLQEVPRENKEYVDIIIKKSRTSEYVKDIQPVIALLEKFKTYIEDDKDIQMFNAIASNYIDHAYYIQTKYAKRPERYYASYRALTSLADDAKEAATLRAEGVVYTRYMPYSDEGQKYTKENLKANSDVLLKKIYDTLYVLKNLD